jgi:hypothetical protein
MSDDWLRRFPGDFPEPPEQPSPQPDPTMADPDEGLEEGPYIPSSPENYATNPGWALAPDHSIKSENLNTVELRGSVDKSVPELLEGCLRLTLGQRFYSVDHPPVIGQDVVELQCTIDEELFNTVKGCLAPIKERFGVDSLEYRLTVSYVDPALRTATRIYPRGEWQPLLI